MTSRTLRIAAIVLLALAGLLALMAWQLGRGAAAQRPEPVRSAAPLHPVVVTTRAVEAGKPLGPESLKVAMLPIDPAGSYPTVQAVAGRVPAMALGANVPVLDTHLAGGLAGEVPDGQRAVAVAVDEVVGVGHRIRPGDFVDVFLVLRQDGQEIAASRSRLLLPRLRVLAYGSNALSDNGAAGEPMSPRRDGARTAVLAVPLGQVSALTMAQQAGRLVLALRNPREETGAADAAVPAMRAEAALPVLPVKLPGEAVNEPVRAVAHPGAAPRFAQAGAGSVAAEGPATGRGSEARAAAGVTLRALAGQAEPVRTAAPVLRPAAPPAQVAVEVIRAGRRGQE